MQDRRRLDSRPVVNRSVRMFPRAMFLAKERVEIPVGSSIAVRRLIWIPIPRLFRMRAPASIMPSSMWADLSVLALRFTDPPMECSVSHTQIKSDPIGQLHPDGAPSSALRNTCGSLDIASATTSRSAGTRRAMIWGGIVPMASYVPIQRYRRLLSAGSP